MTLPACRGSGKSAKKLRKIRASLCAPGPEEGSCNVIATLRHDQSATTESHRIRSREGSNAAESPCRTIAGRADHVLARESLRRFRTSAFCHELLHPIALLGRRTLGIPIHSGWNVL